MGSKLTSDGDAGREVGWLQKFRKEKNGSIETRECQQQPELDRDVDLNSAAGVEQEGTTFCCSLPAVSASGPLLPRLLKPSWQMFPAKFTAIISLHRTMQRCSAPY